MKTPVSGLPFTAYHCGTFIYAALVRGVKPVRDKSAIRKSAPISGMSLSFLSGSQIKVFPYAKPWGPYFPMEPVP
jgi:hypothetical protein